MAATRGNVALDSTARMVQVHRHFCPNTLHFANSNCHNLNKAIYVFTSSCKEFNLPSFYHHLLLAYTMFLPAFLLGQLLLLKAPVVLGQQARSSLTTKRLRILDQQDYSERSLHHRQKRVLKKMGKKSQGSKTAKKQKSTSVALSCDTECPCCGTSGFPEFVAAVDSYSADGDSCYVRNEPTSVNVAVFDCNPYLVAYMSYDYSTDTPPEESRYC